MAVYDKEEIVGYYQGNKILCEDCVDKEDEVKQDEIITADDINDSSKIYFCDGCKEQLK